MKGRIQLLILSIDTSCSTAGVSLSRDGIVISEIVINDKNTHSVKLMPAIDLLFKNVYIDVTDIDAVAVVNGPGSYTGLRIGVSAAKAISYAVDVPVIGVNTLDYLAGSAFLAGDGYVCSVIDARNTHVYYGIYRSFAADGKQKFERICDYGAMPATELCEKIKSMELESVVFCGDGVIANRELFKDLLGDIYREVGSTSLLGRISHVGAIAEEIYHEKKDVRSFSANELDVFYLRMPRISVPKSKLNEVKQ